MDEPYESEDEGGRGHSPCVEVSVTSRSEEWNRLRRRRRSTKTLPTPPLSTASAHSHRSVCMRWSSRGPIVAPGLFVTRPITKRPFVSSQVAIFLCSGRVRSQDFGPKGNKNKDLVHVP